MDYPFSAHSKAAQANVRLQLLFVDHEGYASSCAVLASERSEQARQSRVK
jgi:hypothetical protein